MENGNSLEYAKEQVLEGFPRSDCIYRTINPLSKRWETGLVEWRIWYGYGLWIGILVASGFSVVPVPSAMWKNEFKLPGGTAMKMKNFIFKDDSRKLASTLFPSLSSLLKRRKDHGTSSSPFAVLEAIVLLEKCIPFIGV